ncbi:ABC transporter permease [Bacillus sp. 1P10SD]|uniref:ABC transporter permease n=1 Tax=Bacillus sp. 1P10SD TaxID=3132265 RepID=UPI0039A51690
MSLIDSIKIAISSIVTHKMRSILTMLGIVIGVGSIITIVAIGQGGAEALKSQFVGSKNNTLDIQFHADQPMSAERTPTFNQDSIFQLNQIPEISSVITTNTQTEMVTLGDEAIPSFISGIIKEYFDIYTIQLIDGRFLDSNDFSQSNNFIMINQEAERQFFKNNKALGEMVEMKGQYFQVIGIYKAKNTASALGKPEILLPLSIWPVLFGTDHVQSVTIQTKDVDQLELAGKKAVQVLNEIKPLDLEGKYEVLNIAAIQEGITTITKIMTMVIAGIASISLLVGGIGVMNMMLVSVTERTREIGIRKALGASRRKILLQFLIESIMLTLIGGSIGIVLGVGGAYIVSAFAHWPPLVSPEVVIGGVLFSMSLGIIFGLLPANKAAKLDPIEALRYE